MDSVSGIFNSRADAERAIELLGATRAADEHLVLLSPGTEDEVLEEAVPEPESEEPGTAEKMGTAVGSGGAALGAAAGSALDERASENLRHDQLHLYEAALRQGRSVLVALANDESEAQAMREVLADAGAETLDEARENWWNELRSAEEAAYKKEGRDFALDETLYRRGFEAALHPRLRGKTLADSAVLLVQYFGADQQTEAFQRGYKRGQAYHLDLLEKFPP